MSETLLFFRSFLRDPVQISSVIPTSKSSARRIAGKIDGSVRRVVIEYGPGTGGVAKELLQPGKLSKDSKVILIEKSPEFAELLSQIRDPRLHVFCDSAEHVRRILSNCGETEADYVLCSAPLTMMPVDVRETILSETRQILKRGGSVITYLFRPQTAKWIAEKIGPTTSEVLWMNIPRLIVSEAKKVS